MNDFFEVKDFYPDVKERYADIDIVRSTAKISSDVDLAEKILDLIKKSCYKDLPEQVREVRCFYKEYLSDKLKEGDKAGAKIDLSTLCLAAARKDIVSFGHAGLMIIGDQVYQIQEKRLRNPKLRGRANMTNALLLSYDKKTAFRRHDYELHAHVMFGPEGLRRIQESKAIGEDLKKILEHMGEEEPE